LGKPYVYTASEARKERVIGPSGHRLIDEVVEDQSHESHQHFDDGVSVERILEPGTSAAHQHRAESPDTEEEHQHDDLGVGAMADEQAQVPAPDRFVKEAGRPREDEEEVKEGLHSD